MMMLKYQLQHSMSHYGTMWKGVYTKRSGTPLEVKYLQLFLRKLKPYNLDDRFKTCNSYIDSDLLESGRLILKDLNKKIIFLKLNKILQVQFINSTI